MGEAQLEWCPWRGSHHSDVYDKLAGTSEISDVKQSAARRIEMRVAEKGTDKGDGRAMDSDEKGGHDPDSSE